MGGHGSGRKSIKAEAVYCLLGVQMDLQKVILEGLEDPRVTRDELKKMLIDAVQKIKVTQEEVERI